MVGNVLKWCSDDWNTNVYLLMMNDVKSNSENACEGPQTPCRKVVRGGTLRHYNAVLNELKLLPNATGEQQRWYLKKTIYIAERLRHNDLALTNIGFRCVMDIYRPVEYYDADGNFIITNEDKNVDTTIQVDW